MGRLAKIKDSSGNSIASYSYDELSRKTAVYYYNGASIFYEYDIANHVKKVTNAYNGSSTVFGYPTYDKVGNRKSMKINTTQYDYTYDKLYQLIDADYPGGSAAYGYDKLGVRTSMTEGSTTTYITNNLNQLLSSCTEDCITLYDDNGNLYAWNQVGLPIYEYDCENHLTRALVSGGMDIRYKYDYLGRRVKRTQGSSTIKYVYDGDQIIAEYDGSNNLVRKFVYGAGIDEPVCMIAGSSTYYYHYDGLGSVVALSDSSKTIVEKYSYDVFGAPTILPPNNELRTTSLYGNPYMFTGRQYDAQAQVYYYRARFYSPALGRFLQPDPVKYKAGLNLYTYVGNNPVMYIDPYGLVKWGQLSTGVGQTILGGVAIGTSGVTAAVNPALGLGQAVAGMSALSFGIGNMVGAFAQGAPTLPSSVPGAVGMALAGDTGTGVGDLVSDMAILDATGVALDLIGLGVDFGVDQLIQQMKKGSN